MVKIPTSTRVVQLSDTPVTTLQQGSAMGQGVAAMGQMVQQIAQKEQARQDNEQFLAARTKYDEFNLAFETESAQLQGDATKGLVKKYQEDEETTWNEIYSGLSPRAARAFEQYRGGVVGKKSQFHAFAEHKGRIASAQNTFNNAMAVIAKEAVDAPYDVAALRAKLVQTFDHAVSSGAVQAADREAFLKVKVAGLLENAWSSLYERAPEEALKRSAEYGVSDNMKAVYAERYRDKQSTAQSITLANELSGNGKSLKENLDSVHEKYADQPELHDKLVQRLTLRQAQEESALALQQKEEKNTLFAQMAEAGMDADKIQKIIFSAPIALRDDLRKMGERQLTPNKDVITNPNALLEAEEYIFNGTITDEAQLRMGYYMKLNDEDYNRLTKQLAAKRKGEVPKLTEGEIDRYLAEHEIYKDIESVSGMKRYNFAREFIRSRFERENPTTREEKNIVLANAFRELLQKGRAENTTFWFDSEESYLEASLAGHTNWRMFVPEEHKSSLRHTALFTGFEAKTGEAERQFYEIWRPVYESVPHKELVTIFKGLKKFNKTAKRPKLITPQSVLRVYNTQRN